jgi:hypothetical protein
MQTHAALRRSIKFKAETTAGEALDRCALFGCGRPPARRAGKGLSLTYCRWHQQLRNRHGDYVKRTYTADDLKPYRKAADSYIARHRDDRWVAHAVNSCRLAMEDAGPVERMVDTYRLHPRNKARAALARMRRKGVPPERLVAIHFAVACAVLEDPIRPGGEPGEYRTVQTAKAALRTASGYHSHYGPNHSFHLYPRSTGGLLRHLGKALDRACDLAAERHLDAVLDLKRTRYGARDRTVTRGRA